MSNRSTSSSGRGRRRGRRVVSPCELASLVDATYTSGSLRDLREIMGLIVNSGIRPLELAELRWIDVDFAGGFFTVQEDKKGVRRTVPLAGAFVAIVRKRRSRVQGTEFVLGPDPRALLRRTAKELRALSLRVLGRQVRLTELVVSFEKRWIEAGGSSVTLGLVTGRRTKTGLPNDLPVQQGLRLAAEIMQRVQL